MAENGDNGITYAEWMAEQLGLEPTPELVLRNAAGEPLDLHFNVDVDVVAELVPGGKPFGRLGRLKHDEPRSWVSPRVSFAMLLHLEQESVRLREEESGG